MRPKLTYANVMSTIAVFLVVGGGAAYARSHLAKNSVGTRQLKKNAVTKKKVHKNAISTPKIVNNAVTGAKVEESTLGTVPTADLASNATNADRVDGLDVGCPSGTVLVAGICFETTRRAAANNVFEAMHNCGIEGRYIATPAQLTALDAVIDLGGSEYEYTSSIYVVGVSFMVLGINGNINISNNPTGAKVPYRCVTGPVG